MPMFYRSAVLLSLLSLLGVTAGCGPDSSEAPTAAAERIIVDGRFSDWMKVPPLHADPADDVTQGALDLGRLWAGHDRRFLMLRLEIGTERLLQQANELTLYLDTDSDASTGGAWRGLGVDLTWTFGQREGQFIHGGDTTAIQHADVGLVTAPTVSSTAFEIALDRRAQVAGQPVFSGNTVRIAFADRGPGQDRLPDAAGGVVYPMGSTDSLAPIDPLRIAAPNPEALRVASYNVLNDGLFDPARRPAFRRILQALRPDIMGFQEVYDHSATATRAAVAAMLPADEGASWHAAKAGLDLVAVSRYPIRSTHEIPGYEEHRSAGFVIDTREKLGTSLLFIVMHPPCCTGGNPRRDVQRQRVIDGVLAFIRDAKSEGGAITVARGTPIVIAGDMNFVGNDDLPYSLRTGAIADTLQFGPPIAPDWDRSALTDAAPRLTGWPMNFTWYAPDSRFSPGRLDYVYFTDSVLRPVHRYVLFTPPLTAERLRPLGVQPDDVRQASDHLPVVVDFVRRAP